MGIIYAIMTQPTVGRDRDGYRAPDGAPDVRAAAARSAAARDTANLNRPVRFKELP